MTDVITGLSPEWESMVATTLESAPGLTVTRRCADVAELLSVAEAGRGNCAVVSADLRGLDLTTVRRLARAGLVVLGLYPLGDEGAERRLRQLGVTSILSVDADPDSFAEILSPHADLSGIDALSASSAATATAARLTADGVVIPDHVPDGLVQGDAPTDGILSRTEGEPGPDLASSGSPASVGWQPRGSEEVSEEVSERLDADVRGPEPDASGSGRSTLVAVWGPAGAPGRTTVAVNVAVELASRGQDVLLVDGDTYGGCVAQVLGLLDEAPGLAAACRAADQGTLDLPTLARLAPVVTSRLRVLTGLPKAERWPELRVAALERVLDLARRLSTVIVVDCGFCLEDDEELSYDTTAPRRNEATLTTLSRADTLLAVGGADPVALQRFVRSLQELGSVPSPMPIPVVNRVRATAVGSRPEERIAESLLRFAGLDGLHFVPNDPDTVDAALLAGRTVVEQAPDSTLRASYAELASAVAPWTRTRAGERRSRPWRQGAKRMVSPANV
ncbi:hypothetical protein OO014_06005 [Intrasporangium calvum]|uniref:CobQ/CobB/MinD/ParA nucleotide binding domain-containing protein n=1 Tax=Intrasporangium calvum TaxID=53358 RepID=A0ABT5GG53_9MICO|nr:hypothetical protein [Intrasporangium calvum]MDC5696805.1 hypothetical protein [Intrasporangium calvum]